MKRSPAPFSSLRWKLIGSSLAAICIPLAFLAWWLGSTLWDFYLRQLEQELESVALVLADSAAPLLSDPLAGRQELAEVAAQWERHSKLRIVVADARGRVQEATLGSLEGQAVDEERLPGMSLALHGTMNTTIWKHPDFDFEDTMYVNVPAVQEGAVVGAVRVSFSLRDIEEKMGRIQLLLVVAVLGYTGLVVVLTVLLAGSIVRPVEALTRGAGIMAAGDLEHRVDVGGTWEIRQLGDTLNAMAERLHQLEGMRRRYVSDVSHELRTPLASIRSMAETLAQHGLADPDLQDRYLPRIVHQTDRLARLASQLLDLAQIESGDLLSRKEPVRLAEVVEEAVGSTAAETRAPGIRMDVDVPGDLPPVQGDRDRLVQMVLNLLDNALRHTPDGGRISVRATNGGGEVRLVVADTGPGIPSDHLAHLFERFYRVDRARSPGKGGAGLGLAIVRQIVEAHRGSIEVRSTPGQGATFEITLPGGQES